MLVGKATGSVTGLAAHTVTVLTGLLLVTGFGFSSMSQAGCLCERR